MALETSDEEGHENPLVDEGGESSSHGGRQRLSSPSRRPRFRTMEERRQGGLRSTNPRLRGAEENPGKTNQGAVDPLEAGLVKGGLGSMVHKPAQGITGLASRMFQSKRARNGGLIGGGIVGLSIVIISTFSPVLRLDHLLQNINNKAFAAAGNAVEHRMEYLFERYMVRKITGLRACKAVVSSDCRVNYANAGLATNMYRAWSDARIEDKLFARMGLTVESTTNPDRRIGVHSFTLRDRTGKRVTWSNEQNYNQYINGQFEGGRREFGREMRKGLRDETRWYQVMERVQVRKMLARKHGIKFWCFLSCKKKDAAEEKIKDSRTKWKFRFIERFVYPFSTKYGVILTCITTGDIAGGRCSEKLKEQGIDRRDIPPDEVDKILADLEDAESRGQLRLGSVVLERMLTKIIGQTAARGTLSAIPVAGQIYLGLTILYLLDSIDQAIDNNELSKMAANINATQYIEFYTAIRSDSDAVKKGELPIADLGAHAAEFSGGEKSRVWQAYNKTPTNTLAFLSPSAHAATASAVDEDYKCNNGKPIPNNEQVCEEKKIKRRYKVEEVRDNVFVGGIIDLLNPMGNCLHLSPDLDLGGIGIDVGIDTPCAYTVRDAVGGLLGIVDSAIDAVLGPAVEGAIAVFKAIPGTAQYIAMVTEKFTELALAMFEKVWELPIAVDSPPREKVDGLYAGADLAGSADFPKGGYTDDGGSYGQGAPKIKPAALGAIYQDQLEQEEWEFNNSGFINRIANTSEPKSLVSKVAFSVPTDLSAAFFSVLSAPANLFESLINLPNVLFGSSANAQLAQQQASVNAFGITRYGYSLDHPAITASPSKYTPEYCERTKQARLDSEYVDKFTGFEEYNKADPCLFEARAVESGCTWFVEGNNCGEPPTTSGTTECGDARTMAQAILDHDRIDGIEGDSDVLADLENTAAGRPAYNDVELKPDMLCFILQAAEEGNFTINDLTGHGASHSPDSNHYTGEAVDVGCSGMGVLEDKLDDIARENNGVNNGERCSNTHHAHYDFLD